MSSQAIKIIGLLACLAALEVSGAGENACSQQGIAPGGCGVTSKTSPAAIPSAEQLFERVRATYAAQLDAETLLIRKVFEDTPSGLGGAVQQSTTTFVPQRDPPLGSAQFHFAPPAQ